MQRFHHALTFLAVTGLLLTPATASASGRSMHRSRWLRVAFVLVASLAVATPAGAITFGQIDGNRHPNVGSLVAPWREGGVLDHFCSGTLIAPRVFLTASHWVMHQSSISVGHLTTLLPARLYPR